MRLPFSFSLKDGRNAVCFELGPDDAVETINYLQFVGGETDFLTFGEGEFWITAEQETKLLAETQKRQREVMLGVRVGGRLVSTLSLLREERERIQHVAELGISILKDFWGQGIGAVLIQTSLALAEKRGITKVNLKVRADNTRGIELYRRLGFLHEGTTERAYRVGGKYYAAHLMGMSL